MELTHTSNELATKMNNQSPFVPQGSILEQKNRGRARLKVVVFSLLAIQVVGVLAALLMQGCKQEKPVGTEPDVATLPSTNSPPAPDTNSPTTAATNPTNGSSNAITATPTPPPIVQTPVPPPVIQPQDYVIVQGDNFSSLAKKFGVTTKAIEEANPGVTPTKLQIGQKIHIPQAATAVAAAGTTTSDAIGGEETYTVKSGDTLSAIARQFGVHVRAIRSANNLTTDKIQVGQKLKIPAKSAGLATTITASNVPTDSSPTSSAPSAPRQ